jgi:hypothetical protein
MNFNLNNNNKNSNQINFNNNNNFSNNYFNNNSYNSFNNSNNIFQFMSNLVNFGFNPPYTSDTLKKTPKKEINSNKNKFNNNNNNNFYSSSYKLNNNDNNYDNYNDDFKLDDDNNEKKFMRKMTKAERIEIDKWVEARKKLYPTSKNIELKNKIGELKVEKGLMSNLELKLRKKVNILKKLSSNKKSLKLIKENINFIQHKSIPKETKETENIKNNVSNDEKDEKEKKIDKENILEDGEINEEDKDKSQKGNSLDENNILNENKLIGRKRENDRKKNIRKKIKKAKNKGDKDDKKIITFKKGFKYKTNHLYNELIKKDKIKEQNIILQAIRYLINLKSDEE